MKHTKSSKVIGLLALAVILLAATGCVSRVRVGDLQSESQSVELGDADAVSVNIDFPAGELELSGGAEKLLEADFTYNVDKLKPEVEYSNGKLVVSAPDAEGLSVLPGITEFQNEWGLRLNEQVPMDLKVNVGAGVTNLLLAGLALSGLDVTVGAGETTIDLSGDWASDLEATIDAGAGEVRLRLPKDVGVRVVVDAGVGDIDAPGMTQDGDVYTNAAYGASDVTLDVNVQAGIGKIILELVG